MDTNIISFIAFSFIIAITPGADMALVTRNTISFGKKGGTYTIFGMLFSLISYSILTASGLEMFLDTNRLVYLAIKYLGASYLLYLGFTSLFKAAKNISYEAIPNLIESTHKNLIIQGFLTNFLNPKILFLYVSVMPQFVGLDEAGFFPILKFGLINALVGIIWLYSYMTLLNKLKEKISKPSVHRKIEFATGIAMLLLGIKILIFSE